MFPSQCALTLAGRGYEVIRALGEDDAKKLNVALNRRFDGGKLQIHAIPNDNGNPDFKPTGDRFRTERLPTSEKWSFARVRHYYLWMLDHVVWRMDIIRILCKV